MPTPEAVSGGSAGSFGSLYERNWYCSLFGTDYRWEYGQFTQCSITCGIGKKYKQAVCKEYSGRVVDDTHCVCQDPPPVVVVDCATKLCQSR